MEGMKNERAKKVKKQASFTDSPPQPTLVHTVHTLTIRL